MPCPQDLGPKNLLEAFPALIAHGPVGEHPHAVNDPGQGRHVGINSLKHPLDGGGNGHVGQLHPHIRPLLPEGVNDLLGFGVRGPAAVEDDNPRLTFGQPAGDDRADASQAAGYKVGPVGTQPALSHGGHNDDVLADVPGRPHELHGRNDLGHGPAG